MKESNWGLSSSTLKWIAIVTMLIDHVAATVLTRILIGYSYNPELTNLVAVDNNYMILYGIMRIMRTIGRLAFPIFCFLLVEGFGRTGNVKKYILRMGIFAIAAEVPFDLAFTGKAVYLGYQNVMLTLLVGLLTMWGCSLIEKRFSQKKVLQIVGDILCTIAGMALAHFMQTDYGAKGIICIMVLYFFRNTGILQMFAGAASFIWEAPAMLAFPIINLYNGQRGMKMKYFFYLFYPLHLLILYFIGVLLGLNQIAVISV